MKAQSAVGSLLCCLLALAAGGPLVGQLPADRVNTARSTPQPAEFKGEAKVSSHAYKMQAGNTYRLTVKGDGFVPQVAIQGQASGFPPLSMPSLNPALGAGTTAQLLFTPTDTRVYQIMVGYAASTDINKGPHAYTLTIERALFKPHVVVKDPPFEISEHTNKMEQGKFYSITVTGRGFAPELQILDGNRPMATAFNGRWFGFGPDAEFVTNMTFMPARTTDYRIVVAVGPVTEQRKAPLTYDTQIVELKVELSVNEQLTKQDPVDTRRGGHAKVHTVKLEAGKTYQIDMISQVLDSYLFLEDIIGRQLMQDDDSGGNLNARLVFRPTTTGSYRIVATTFDRGQAKAATGPYTLTVVDNPDSQPRFGMPAPFAGKPADLPK